MVKQQRNISPQDKALIERQIAGGLHALYDKAVLEPLPDVMAELLEQLKERERGERA
jgi:hypothetical protein